jgi:hypothetical protein
VGPAVVQLRRGPGGHARVAAGSVAVHPEMARPAVALLSPSRRRFPGRRLRSRPRPPPARCWRGTKRRR